MENASNFIFQILARFEREGYLEDKKWILQSKENQQFEARKSSRRLFGAGLAECAELAKALELANSRVPIQQAGEGTSPIRGVEKHMIKETAR